MKSKYKIVDYLFFAIAGVVYFLFIRQYTMGADDIVYSYVQGTDWEPVKSFSDIIRSNVWAYFNWNGRFLAHCVVLFFCGFGLYGLFYICSSIVFVLLLVFLVKLVDYKSSSLLKKNAQFDKYVVVLGLLLLLPDMGRTFLGNVAFVVNYMWGSSFCVMFLYVYESVKNSQKGFGIIGCVLLFLFGIICGAWQESFAIGIGGALGVCTLFRLKETTKETWWLLAGFALGLLTALLAPSNISRYMEVRGVLPQDQSMIEKMQYLFFSRIKHMLRLLPSFCCSMILALISVVMDWHGRKRIVFLKEYALYFLISLFAFLFAVFVTFFGAYQMTILGVMAVLQICFFLNYYLENVLNRNNALYVKLCVAVAIICLVIPIYVYRQKVYDAYSEMIEQAKQTESGILFDPALERIQCELSDKFLYSYTNLTQINFLVTQRKNFLSQFFGKTIVNVQPMNAVEIATCCSPQNKVQDSVYQLSDYHNYYLLCLPRETDVCSTKIMLKLKAKTLVDKAKDRIRNRQTKDFEYSISEVSNRIVKTDDCLYVLFGAGILKKRSFDELAIIEMEYE